MGYTYSWRGDDDDGVLRIDCESCCMRATQACDDCIVTFLCSRDGDGAVVVDVAEVRALRALQRAGLAPSLRHRPNRPSSGSGELSETLRR
jgi:hypothetical protein